MYQSDGTTGAANVEIGIFAGGVMYTAYSANNGNFWFEGANETISGPEWNDAEIRIRNGDGELAMSISGSGDCNACHSGGDELVEPQ